MEKPVLLYDGMCNLCNWGVRFVLAHEKDNKIHFASLQSQTGQQILKDYNSSLRELESVVFITEGKMYVKSAAAFKISKHLKKPWFFLGLFGFLPISLMNFMYDLIAWNRYNIFGKQESCMIPDEKWKSRFFG